MDIEALEVAVHECQSVNSPLDYACRNRPEGLVLEFGVAVGSTIKKIAEAIKPDVVYGFDSWQGLPEPWDYNDQQTYQVGYLRCAMPEVPKNVELVVGLFQETLVPFLETHPGNVAVAHIDCDIYASARYVLMALNERLVAGTFLVFDELLGYAHWRNHEWRALTEWLGECGRVVEPMCRSSFAVAFQVMGPTY